MWGEAMNRRRGFTLVMAIVVLALASGLGAVLTAPALRESIVVRRHQARLQAEYLALAGLEYVRSLEQMPSDALEKTYTLGNGEVSVTIRPGEHQQYTVTSVGSVNAGGGRGTVTWTLERRITAK
jgi:type II secretory pathway pseudopilin PulG